MVSRMLVVVFPMHFVVEKCLELSGSSVVAIQQVSGTAMFNGSREKDTEAKEKSLQIRRWRYITSTSDFIQLHKRHSAPEIGKDHLVAFLDKCWEPTQTQSNIQKLYTDSLFGHCKIEWSNPGKVVTFFLGVMYTQCMESLNQLPCGIKSWFSVRRKAICVQS